MEVFVARQPIFDVQQKVYAYELLYRVGSENHFNQSEGDYATAEVIANSFLLIGIEALTGGKRAFINFTKNLLESEIAANLPRDLIAIELLEDIEPNEEAINACKHLKQLGYMVVLDDFIYDDRYKPLIELADIIKVDFLKTSITEQRDIVRRIGSTKVKFLAEKVETRETFEQAREMGYDYFQGYFFAKPEILKGTDVPSYKLNYLEILRETNETEPDFGRIEFNIRRDISLSFKLLKYINSASYGLRNRIYSIRQALVLLGIDEIKKWIALVALKVMSEGKPDEIIRSSIIRARFGELLAPKVGFANLSSEMFLMGLFSMIDALIDKPMDEIVNDLPISEDIKGALLGRPVLHREIYELILYYEKGDWNSFSDCAKKLQLEVNDVPEAFVKSIEWADQLFVI